MKTQKTRVIDTSFSLSQVKLHVRLRPTADRNPSIVRNRLDPSSRFSLGYPRDYTTETRRLDHRVDTYVPKSLHVYKRGKDLPCAHILHVPIVHTMCARVQCTYVYADRVTRPADGTYKYICVIFFYVSLKTRREKRNL